ncbi:uncharacterized protein LOC129601858 [Paramacrobiotus metropolitanus]|uniref:uncharacterized protein LOC129601858 n=1 Tax=Paramacrobiotus metropolitanus TaxID=2943436 RepID=UPI002445A868|nr:uncharacterized protein LOC129601858 [Paramacrobiotus metropolitanus]
MDSIAERTSGSWGIMLNSMEHQNLELARYNMQKRTAEERYAEDIPLHNSFGNRSIVLEDPQEKQNKLKALEGKLIHPDNFEGAKDASACIVSSLDAQRLEMIKDKQDVAEVLAGITSKTKHILKHLKPVYLDPIEELVILTESERDFHPLSAMLVTREFRITLVPTFTKQIVSGLRMIHEYGIVHKDIRCSNILVQRHQTEGTTNFTLKMPTLKKLHVVIGNQDII